MSWTGAGAVRRRGAGPAAASEALYPLRSFSLRGRTLILNPSGLIVSVSFRCIW